MQCYYYPFTVGFTDLDMLLTTIYIQLQVNCSFPDTIIDFSEVLWDNFQVLLSRCTNYSVLRSVKCRFS